MSQRLYQPEQLESREEFRRLGYWQQWDCCVAYFARTGNRSALAAILFHQACFAVHLGVCKTQNTKLFFFTNLAVLVNTTLLNICMVE